FSTKKGLEPSEPAGGSSRLVSKSVTTVLERETKLDPKAIEMMTQAVQSILLREVGSVVGEILDHAEGATPLMSTCTFASRDSRLRETQTAPHLRPAQLTRTHANPRAKVVCRRAAPPAARAVTTRGSECRVPLREL